MTIRFEHGALLAVAGLVTGLILTVGLNPLNTETSSPKASLRLAVSQPIPEKKAAPNAAGDVLSVPEMIVEKAAQAVADLVAGVAAKIVSTPRDMAGIDTLTGVYSVDDIDLAHRLQWLKTTGALSKTFKALDYDLDRVRSGTAAVPRLFLASLPGDIKNIRETRVRKSLFFKTVLPLILQANEEILRDRRRLWSIHFQKSLGKKLDPSDRLWLMVMEERYGVKRGALDALLKRVDIIPPSLALAQAAEESGWGTSRFVREGNAVFGQWTFSDNGSLVPSQRDDGKVHRVRTFSNLLDSVRAYARNLNTHPAYRKMRRQRHGLRLKGAPLDGLLMVENLKSYSQRGEKYIDAIRTLIETNNLHRLDDARLRDGTSQPRSLI